LGLHAATPHKTGQQLYEYLVRGGTGLSRTDHLQENLTKQIIPLKIVNIYKLSAVFACILHIHLAIENQYISSISDFNSYNLSQLLEVWIFELKRFEGDAYFELEKCP
jgi:hypothetical protein